jgi:hypothetical protein
MMPLSARSLFASGDHGTTQRRPEEGPLRSLPRIGALLGTLCAAACKPAVPGVAVSDTASAAVTVDSGFATVPDSVWVVVSGPTLIGFHPVVTNEQLEADEGLAAALDDLSYHVGTAMDSLLAAGFMVQFRGGDTLWMRAGKVRSRFVRTPDSATVGYVFADTLGRRAAVYGVRTYVDLVAYAHEFKRAGRINP